MTDRPGDVRRAGAARRARGLLRPLAGMYGIQLSHTRVGGQRVAATADALLAGLSSLGAPVASLGDVPDALRARRVELWSRVVEPVTVAWDGRMPQVELRLPARDAQRPAGVEAELEDGRVVRWRGSGASPRRVVERADVEGVPHVRIALPAPGTIPFGYHTLHVRVGNDAHTSLVISAPFSPGRPPDRSWGAFLPLYALRTSRSWGVGDLADLDALTGWLAGLGGSVVATLPLLAAFLDEREGLFEPSPYAPVSRLFWNELYVDPTGVPELERSVEARALIRSRRFRTELESLRRARLVDYRRAITAKRAVLEAMARTLFSESTPRAGELRRFVRSHPRLADYARFRAACRTFGLPWRRFRASSCTWEVRGWARS